MMCLEQVHKKRTTVAPERDKATEESREMRNKGLHNMKEIRRHKFRKELLVIQISSEYEWSLIQILHWKLIESLPFVTEEVNFSEYVTESTA